MSKTPIEPADIRKGDLIRFEYAGGESAHEYRANCDREKWQHLIGQHYLLDRPKPKVELPTEPGFYSDRSGDAWKLVSGRWWFGGERFLTDDAARYAPFTKLEPVQVTAKKVLDAVVAWSFGACRAEDVETAAEMQTRLRAEFGVTD